MTLRGLVIFIHVAAMVGLFAALTVEGVASAGTRRAASAERRSGEGVGAAVALADAVGPVRSVGPEGAGSD
jgi:hypothetical protein